MPNINSLSKSFLPLLLLATLSQNARADYAERDVEGVFSIGTGAQYGGFGVQAGGNFNRASLYFFGGNRSVGIGANLRLNQHASLGISYGGGFSADIVDEVLNQVLFDDTDDECGYYDDCRWFNVEDNVDEEFLSLSFIIDNGGFYRPGLNFGLDVGVKREVYEYRPDSNYKSFVGLTIGYRF